MLSTAQSFRAQRPRTLHQLLLPRTLGSSKRGLSRSSRLQCQAVQRLQVVFVTTEVAPWSKSGGLADVLSGLPAALAARGHRVMTVSPMYSDYHDAVDSGARAPVSVGSKLPTPWPQDDPQSSNLSASAQPALITASAAATATQAASEPTHAGHPRTSYAPHHAPDQPLTAAKYFLSDIGDGVQYVFVDHPVFKDSPPGGDSVYTPTDTLPTHPPSDPAPASATYCNGPAGTGESLQIRNSVLCQAALAAPVLLWPDYQQAGLSLQEQAELARMQEQLLHMEHALGGGSTANGKGRPQPWGMANGVVKSASVHSGLTHAGRQGGRGRLRAQAQAQTPAQTQQQFVPHHDMLAAAVTAQQQAGALQDALTQHGGSTDSAIKDVDGTIRDLDSAIKALDSAISLPAYIGADQNSGSGAASQLGAAAAMQLGTAAAAAAQAAFTAAAADLFAADWLISRGTAKRDPTAAGQPGSTATATQADVTAAAAGMPDLTTQSGATAASAAAAAAQVDFTAAAADVPVLDWPTLAAAWPDLPPVWAEAAAKAAAGFRGSGSGDPQPEQAQQPASDNVIFVGNDWPSGLLALWLQAGLDLLESSSSSGSSSSSKAAVEQADAAQVAGEDVTHLQTEAPFVQPDPSADIPLQRTRRTQRQASPDTTTASSLPNPSAADPICMGLEDAATYLWDEETESFAALELPQSQLQIVAQQAQLAAERLEVGEAGARATGAQKRRRRLGRAARQWRGLQYSYKAWQGVGPAPAPWQVVGPAPAPVDAGVSGLAGASAADADGPQGMAAGDSIAGALASADTPAPSAVQLQAADMGSLSASTVPQAPEPVAMGSQASIATGQLPAEPASQGVDASTSAATAQLPAEPASQAVGSQAPAATAQLPAEPVSQAVGSRQASAATAQPPAEPVSQAVDSRQAPAATAQLPAEPVSQAVDSRQASAATAQPPAEPVSQAVDSRQASAATAQPPAEPVSQAVDSRQAPAATAQLPAEPVSQAVDSRQASAATAQPPAEPVSQAVDSRQAPAATAQLPAEPVSQAVDSRQASAATVQPPAEPPVPSAFVELSATEVAAGFQANISASASDPDGKPAPIHIWRTSPVTFTSIPNPAPTAASPSELAGGVETGSAAGAAEVGREAVREWDVEAEGEGEAWVAQQQLRKAWAARQQQERAVRAVQRRLAAFQKLIAQRLKGAKFALTIHNAAYQGLFSASSFASLGLPASARQYLITEDTTPAPPPAPLTNSPPQPATVSDSTTLDTTQNATLDTAETPAVPPRVPLVMADASSSDGADGATTPLGAVGGSGEQAGAARGSGEQVALAGVAAADAAAAAAPSPPAPLLSWLQAALMTSDLVVTVSPQYALELMEQADLAQKQLETATAVTAADRLAVEVAVNPDEVAQGAAAAGGTPATAPIQADGEAAGLVPGSVPVDEPQRREWGRGGWLPSATVISPTPELDGSNGPAAELVYSSVASATGVATTGDALSTGTNSTGTAAASNTGAQLSAHTRRLFAAIRERGVLGIMNGINTAVWGPEGDSYLPRALRYGPEDVHEKKAAAKALLQSRLGLDVDPSAPLIAFIGRLEEQKGADVLLAALPALLGAPATAVVDPRTGTRAHVTGVTAITGVDPRTGTRAHVTGVTAITGAAPKPGSVAAPVLATAGAAARMDAPVDPNAAVNSTPAAASGMGTQATPEPAVAAQPGTEAASVTATTTAATTAAVAVSSTDTAVRPVIHVAPVSRPRKARRATRARTGRDTPSPSNPAVPNTPSGPLATAAAAVSEGQASNTAPASTATAAAAAASGDNLATEAGSQQNVAAPVPAAQLGADHIEQALPAAAKPAPPAQTGADHSNDAIDLPGTGHPGHPGHPGTPSPQVIMLGSGLHWQERCLSQLTNAWPGRASGYPAFNEPLAHLLMAAADYLVVPSRYEPCGLVALCAVRYGTLPVVSPVGGLPEAASSGGAGGAPPVQPQTVKSSQVGGTLPAVIPVHGLSGGDPGLLGARQAPAMPEVGQAGRPSKAMPAAGASGTAASLGYVLPTPVGSPDDPVAFRQAVTSLTATLRSALADHGSAAFLARREACLQRDVSWDASAEAWEGALTRLVQPAPAAAEPAATSAAEPSSD